MYNAYFTFIPSHFRGKQRKKHNTTSRHYSRPQVGTHTLIQWSGTCHAATCRKRLFTCGALARSRQIAIAITTATFTYTENGKFFPTLVPTPACSEGPSPNPVSYKRVDHTRYTLHAMGRERQGPLRPFHRDHEVSGNLPQTSNATTACPLLYIYFCSADDELAVGGDANRATAFHNHRGRASRCVGAARWQWGWRECDGR